MDNRLQWIFELRAQVAGLTAAVRQVREFQRAVVGATSAARAASAGMGAEFRETGYAARSLSLALAGVGAARGGFAALASGAARARAEMAALSSSVFNLRNLLIAGTAGYGAKLVIDAVSFKENTLIAFQTLLGSREEAERMMREAVRFAAATPFETRDVIDAYQRLLTAGFKPVEIPVVLKGVGDLAALKGFDKGVIDRVLYAIQQIRAKGRLQGEELMQLAEAGVPLGKVYEVLGRRIGKSADDVRKLQEAGRISADLGIVAVLEALRDTVSGGRLGSMMDRTSRSISGLLSTLRSRPTELLMDINLDPVRNTLANLVTLTDTTRRTGQRLKAMLERYIGGAFRSVFGSLADATDPSRAEANLNRFLDSVERTIAQVSLAWQRIRPAIVETWRGVMDGIRAAQSVAQTVAPVLNAVAQALGSTAGGMEASTTSGFRLLGMGIALAGAWRLLNLLTLGMAGSVVRWGGLAVLWFGRAGLAALRYAVAHRAAIMAAASSMGPMLARLGMGALTILRLATPWGLVATAAAFAVGYIIRNWDSIKAFFGKLWGTLTSQARSAWAGFVNVALGAGRAVWDWFRSLPGRIVEAVRGAGSRFVEGLREIVRRVPGGDLLLRALDAAGGVARQAWEWGKGVARAIGDGAREGLGIRSPSRVFAHIGAMTALGLAVGLQNAAPMVERATQTLLQATQVAPAIEAAIRLPEGAPKRPEPPRASEPLEVALPKLEPLEVALPKLEPLEVALPKLEPLEVALPKLEPLEVALPKLEPLEVALPKLEPLEVALPKLEPLEVALPKLEPLEVALPKLEPLEVALPKLEPLEVALPKLEPLEVALPKLEPLEVALPKLEPLEVALPKLEPLEVALPKLEPLEVALPKLEPLEVALPKLEPLEVALPKLEPLEVALPKLEPLEVALPKLEPLKAFSPVPSDVVLPVVDIPRPPRAPEVVDIPRPPRAPEVVGLKVVPTLRSPEAPPPPPAPLHPVVTALAPTTRETVVHIHVNGAQDPRKVAREVVAAIDHWAAGRIVVLGLEALASEVGHDA
ncbi:tape measure protein [Thermus sp. NEB1569]|uniref:tape measure protein n=1 Tax=Thermus sp. NEB1569 TaxID=2918899 RepID=UPI001EFABCC1|nr:tape measure protein [Thermus sp. NEB1569]ULR41399.1 tape measure protein [Thermus sp. NEB1569]